MQKKCPSYIENAKKHNKKIIENNIKIKKEKALLLERKKGGRSINPIIHDKDELMNIKNMKTQFWRSAVNYKLSDNGLLLYKKKLKK